MIASDLGQSSLDLLELRSLLVKLLQRGKISTVPGHG
jgi:hypothetical protein